MGDPLSRLLAVQARIRDACLRAGRAPDSVRLLAVSKTHPPEAIAALHRAGLNSFGESKIQELQQKIPLCPAAIDWHLIGHLQSNKAKFAARLASTLHSVDSLDLAQLLSREADKAGRGLDILVQVNVAGERSKFGLSPDQARACVPAINALPRLRLVGLMTIPPFTPNPADAHPSFAALRLLRDHIERDSGLHLPELSMGMSHDLEPAIAEGATWLRIGTALFGERPRPNSGA